MAVHLHLKHPHTDTPRLSDSRYLETSLVSSQTLSSTHLTLERLTGSVLEVTDGHYSSAPLPPAHPVHLDTTTSTQLTTSGTDLLLHPDTTVEWLQPVTLLTAFQRLLQNQIPTHQQLHTLLWLIHTLQTEL